MNLSESLSYEPDGASIRWFVAHSGRPKIKHIAPLHIPALRAERGDAPALRAPYAIELWRIICEAKEPISKAAWMDLANIHGKSERTNGASAIVNMKLGKWVRERNNLFWRA